MADLDLKQFRPLNGWMLVQMDPLSQVTESGTLFKPHQGAYEHLHRKGTVLKKSILYEISKRKGTEHEVVNPISEGSRVIFSAIHGDKIYFRTFKEMSDNLNIILLKPSDIELYDDPSEEGKGVDDVLIG